MKNLAPLLALLPVADALPSRRRIPAILADIRLQKERRKQQKQQKQQQQQHQQQQQKRGRPETEISPFYLSLPLPLHSFPSIFLPPFPFPSIFLPPSPLIKESDVETLNFDQRLDHFSDEKEGEFETFEQRYFYTSRFVSKNKNGGEIGVSNGNSKEGGEKKLLAFLCVGGEGPSLDPSVLTNSVHCTGDMIGLAEKLHKERGMDVHLFALEHRFYGESFPDQIEEGDFEREVEVEGTGFGFLRGAEAEVEDEDEEEDEDEAFGVDLSHLSSRQAVKDIVSFVKSPEVAKKISPDKVTWITFGGSYPGMLSAWSHLLHPSTIFAAVSNSAPLQAELDFTEYKEVVGRDLADAEVGGSDECLKIVREGHEQVVAALEGRGHEGEEEERERSGEDEDGVERVANMFNVCGGAKQLKASRRNMDVFVGDGLLDVPAQKNDPSCNLGLCNIERLCDAVIGEQKSNPGLSSMEVLANVKKVQDGDDKCDRADWQAYLDWFGAPTKNNANIRSWMYQTCSEFGFYQTCNKDSKCPFGRGYHDVSQDLELCQVVFGIDPDTVRKNVDSTLTYYGGWSLTPDASAMEGPNRGFSMLEGGEDHEEDAGEGGKRLVFVTGTVDPWTALAVTGGRGNADHPAVSVEGASHHFWTHEVEDDDGEEIQRARETIYETVEGWLGLSAGIVVTE